MGSALGYAISSRGGDYNNVYASLEYGWPPEKAMEAFGTTDAVDITLNQVAKVRLVKRAVLVNIMVDCLGLCKVPVLSLLGTFNLEYEASLVSGLIGETHHPRETFQCRRPMWLPWSENSTFPMRRKNQKIPSRHVF